MIRLKTNLVDDLRNAGYTSYRIRKERIMGESELQSLREGNLPSWAKLDMILSITHKSIDDVLEHIPETIAAGKDDE